MRRKAAAVGFILALVALDQASKALVSCSVPLFESRTVIPGFFNITHIRNTGAIFGFLSHAGSPAVQWILTLASLAALGLVVYYFVRTPGRDALMLTALSLVLAGAVGNLIDRALRGSVVDFLDFYIKRRHWPFFNVADFCISIGSVLLIVILFRRKPA